ncbi:pickpocket protein 28 [Anabrus simplex]|uniref:pickpocket protein 28 n=1 Tax=Anabrus simplex TaxID=316456 RepID=UPI0035A3C5B8
MSPFCWLEHSSEVTIMDWPSRSPYLNPIEHFWDAVGAGVCSMNTAPNTQDQLWIALQEALVQIPPERFQYLVESMPRRIAAVLRPYIQCFPMIFSHSVPKRVSNEKNLSVSWVGDDTPDGDHLPGLKTRTRPPSRALSYFREYCSNTSLHGLQYLGEEQRPLTERMCWLMMICASIVCCMYVIMMQWNKWQNSPVIVTFADRYTPASNIPFPAITICSEVKFKQSKHNHTDLLLRNEVGNLTDEEKKKLRCSSLVCNDYSFQRGNKTADEDFLETFLKFAPEVDDLLKFCVWRSKQIPCRELFHPIITDDGLCYTFNTITAEHLFTDHAVQKNYSTIGKSQKTKDWSLERGYFFEEDFNDTYPRRTLADGKSAGLMISMEALDHEVDSYCQIPMEGFKVVVHNPAVFPEVEEVFIRVPSQRDVVVGIHPKIISTTEELRNYNPKLRQCYFDNERNLHFFNIYTQENCEIECFNNYTVEMCGCARFHMTHKYNYDTKHHSKCSCLPACTELRYDVETTQAAYLWGKIRKDMENATYGTLTIFLRDMQIITRRRSELYGPSDFVANCGGLLGLFMGFSILSLVEIIYFLTLRLWLKIHRNHTKSNTSSDR